MVKVIEEDPNEVVNQYEAEIDLRTAMDLDPSDGPTTMSKGAALKRANAAPEKSSDLIDLLIDLDADCTIQVIPMVNSSVNPAELYFEMRIRPGKE